MAGKSAVMNSRYKHRSKFCRGFRTRCLNAESAECRRVRRENDPCVSSHSLRSRRRGSVSSPFKNSFRCRSRRKEAQISSETKSNSKPPHVGSYFFNGLLGVHHLRRGLLRHVRKESLGV